MKLTKTILSPRHQDISGENFHFARVINFSLPDNGLEFFTDGTFSQEVGLMSYPAGHKIRPHYHRPQERHLANTQEVLIILKGSLFVDFFAPNSEYFGSVKIDKGNLIILLEGGHGFEVGEDCEFIEVKQGPFSSEIDKKYLPNFDPSHRCIYD